MTNDPWWILNDDLRCIFSVSQIWEKFDDDPSLFETHWPALPIWLHAWNWKWEQFSRTKIVILMADNVALVTIRTRIIDCHINTGIARIIALLIWSFLNQENTHTEAVPPPKSTDILKQRSRYPKEMLHTRTHKRTMRSCLESYTYTHTHIQVFPLRKSSSRGQSNDADTKKRSIPFVV